MSDSVAEAVEGHVGCMLCALNGARTTLAEKAFHVNGFDILRCPRCRLLWTRVPKNYDPDSIYTEQYFQGGRSDGYFDYVGSEAFLTREYRARLALIRSYQPQGRLFEIGCASGGFLEQASRYYRVQGVDVSDFAVGIARQKGLDVFAGRFETSGALRPTYDAVVMFDTIEHLKDPIGTLRAVHEHLERGGFLFLSTGDSQSFSARILGSRWRLMTPPQHLWFFSRRNITILLECLGYNLFAAHYPWRFVPLTLIWYQLFRGRAKPLPRLVNHVVVPVNLYDTMVVVARKRE